MVAAVAIQSLASRRSKGGRTTAEGATAFVGGRRGGSDVGRESDVAGVPCTTTVYVCVCMNVTRAAVDAHDDLPQKIYTYNV